MVKEIDNVEGEFFSVDVDLATLTDRLVEDGVWPGETRTQETVDYLVERLAKKEAFVEEKENEREHHICETDNLEQNKSIFLNMAIESSKKDVVTINTILAKEELGSRSITTGELENIRDRCLNIEKEGTDLLNKWNEYHETVNGNTEGATEVETNVKTTVDTGGNTEENTEENTEVNSEDGSSSEEPANQDSLDWFDLF